MPPDEFVDPPAALLAPPTANGAITLSPTAGGPGTTITADGTGYNQCVAGWYVTIGAAQSVPQVGSTDDRRTTTLVVPGDAAPGQADVQAWCDMGAGPQSVAHAAFTVNAPPPPPSTAAPPSSAPPPPVTAQQEPTTTTTSPATSTTTTTAPQP